MESPSAPTDHLCMSFGTERGRAAENPFESDGAGRRRRHHGLTGVLFWHGIAATAAVVLTAVFMVTIALSPGGLTNPEDFVPGWLIPVLFAFVACGALTVSLVISVLTMALAAPVMKRVDLDKHALLVSLTSLF